MMLAGCTPSESPATSEPTAVEVTPNPDRDVSASSSTGLTCVDTLDDVESDPGFDIDQVNISLSDTYLTARFTVGQLAYKSDANTEFQLYIDSRDSSPGLRLTAWLTYDNTFTLGQWTANGGDRDVSGGSIYVHDDVYTIGWPLEDVNGSVPADFTWWSHVIYNRNKHDSCPGERGVTDESMYGSWTVADPLG